MVDNYSERYIPPKDPSEDTPSEDFIQSAAALGEKSQNRTMRGMLGRRGKNYYLDDSNPITKGSPRKIGRTLESSI